MSLDYIIESLDLTPSYSLALTKKNRVAIIEAKSLDQDSQPGYKPLESCLHPGTATILQYETPETARLNFYKFAQMAMAEFDNYDAFVLRLAFQHRELVKALSEAN